jgi:hypothetical protein
MQANAHESSLVRASCFLRRIVELDRDLARVLEKDLVDPEIGDCALPISNAVGSET